eukprot:scaffold4515_cov124-Skeletonema_dohrnii-CCMP3373.AAC.3
MSNQFELALRKYIAAFDGIKDNISTAEFKSRFDNLHHKYFNFVLVPRSKGLLTLTLKREEVFELEAARLANGTKVTLVHFRKVSLDCVDIMLRLVSGKEETTVRVVTVITANQAVASREIEESFQLEGNIEVEPQDEASQLPKLLTMIKNREWDLLSNDLTPETLRAAAQEDDLSENVGSLLHFALHFDAPSSIIYQITDGMHSSVLHRDAKDRLPLHIAAARRGHQSYLIFSVSTP